MDEIDILINRGVNTIYPTKEELEKILRSGKKLKLYQGFDPTGKDLHIGHMIGLRKLAQFQKLGHEVIFLIGDFTGMVGDPSGKTEARKMLTSEEVQENAKSYIKQAGKILNFEASNPVKILFNSEWLGKISALEFMRIASNLSVQQVVERDLFQERQKTGNDIFMNEFLYPVMQAYDSVHMQVDLEIGGNDQMFNMLMGRKLMRNMLKKDKFVITTPLLTDSGGRKIGKTEGNIISLTDTPEVLFGKIMSLSDDIILKGLEYLTDIPTTEISDIEQKLAKGDNPIQFKKILAYEIVKQLNSDESAQKAQDAFQSTVQNKELPTNIPEYKVEGDKGIFDILVDSGSVESKSEAKRLLEQGGLELDGEKLTIESLDQNLQSGMILKVGKHKYLKIG